MSITTELPSQMSYEEQMPSFGLDYASSTNGAESNGAESAEQQTDPIDLIVEGVDPNTVDEDTIEDLIDRHPLASELASGLVELRASGRLSELDEKNYVNNIVSARSEIGTEIKVRLGLTVESEEQAARRKELERLQSLGRILTSLTGQEGEEELLVKYGLVDKDGSMNPDSIKSPLFKQETERAFESYLRYAINFDAMEQAAIMGGGRLRNMDRASNLRGEAHNNVSQLVERDLGLPFDAARRFVSKMREARAPGTHEKSNYAAILRGEKLAEKFGHDAAAFTEDSLRDLIAKPMDHER